MELLNNFQEIVIEKPVDKIISQIKELIMSGQLKPGDKLPPERKLCERLGTSRTYVRDAIRKLEFYGILKTQPQSGTVVAGLGMTALEGLISDVLQVEGNDFESLVESRLILETNCAKLAASRRTNDDIERIEEALVAYKDKVDQGGSAIDEDLLFHLKIAEASKNSVLKSLMLVVTPDILTYFRKHHVCENGRNKNAYEEHVAILNDIKNKDPKAAVDHMKHHLDDLIDYTHSIHSSEVNGLAE
ncbi:MAG: FadR family transcriptional regulator [Cyclobacteriaceae bacterium]